jgi:hypothetical protein
MKKQTGIWISLFVVILVIGAAIWIYGEADRSEERVGELEEESNGEEGGDASVRGIVTRIDESQAMVDGPFVIELAVENGDDTAVIHVPSMGILLCDAREDMVDISLLEVGMTVEARGAVNADVGGAITPCESEEHYLRVVSQ